MYMCARIPFRAVYNIMLNERARGDTSQKMNKKIVRKSRREKYT